MAKINPIKVKQEADKQEKAGKLDQAIVLYRQLVEDNPRDWNTINKIGDLFAKLNKTKEASVEYAKVADFYARDGFLLKAIAIWKKINKLDPTVLDPYVNLADLYGKQGLMMEAKSQYQIVVDEYVKRGRMREAGDVLKKMAEIDPADLKVRSRLADLYTREGNAGKAVDEHVAIAEELNKKGHLAEAVQVLEKGLKIDPKSHKLRLELGRIHLVQKNHERAAHFLEEAVQQSPNDPAILVRLGEAYLGAKKIEEAEAIFKRLIELNPQDHESRAQMGRVYLLQGQFDKAFGEFQPVVDKLVERREGEKAAALLTQIIQKNPQHVKTLQKLAEVYRTTQNDRGAVGTYVQLSEALINHHQYDQAVSVLETLISLEPQNQQHKQKLQMVRGKAGESGRGPAASSAGPGLDDGEDIEFEDADDLPMAPPPAGLKTAKPTVPPPRPAAAPKAAPPRAAARPSIELSAPLSGDDSEFIEEHLAEGRVFRKYGLIDKAADQFEAIIARFPDHVDARHELRDLFKEKGQAGKAAEQCLALAEICRLKGDAAGAVTYENEVRQLAPEMAPAAAPAKPGAAVRAPAAAPPPAPDDDEEEISIEHGEEEVLLEVEESGLEAQNPLGVGSGPLLEEEIGNTGQFSSPFVEEEEELAVPVAEEDVEIDVDEGAEAIPTFEAEAVADEEPPLTFDESEELPFPAPAAAPPGPPPRAPAPPVAAAPPPRPAPVPKPSPPPPPPPAPPVAKRPPAPPAAPALPADLQRLLDEVESYVSLGFVDDAREALREVRSRYPSHPAIDAKISDLGLVEDEETAPAPVLKPRPATPPPSKPAPPPPPPAPVVAKPAPPARPAPAPPPPRAASVPEPELEPEAELDLDNLGADSGFGAVPEDDPFGSPAGESLASDDPLGDLAMDVSEPEPEPPPPPVRPRRADQTLPPPPLQSRPPVRREPEPEPELDAFSPDESPVMESDSSYVDMSVEDLVGHSAAPPDNHGELDLGAELGGLFDAHEAVEAGPPAGTELGDAGLAEIFKEFKAGVDRQLGKEDYDTRYNLGIAYKEMGLVDEAIAEFQLAAKDEKRALECSSMLGLCFMEKGMPKLAVKWFERGLKAPGRTDEEYLGLRYDLATAHEASGDVDAARDMFSELWSQNANFRDVAEKVRALGGD